LPRSFPFPFRGKVVLYQLSYFRRKKGYFRNMMPFYAPLCAFTFTLPGSGQFHLPDFATANVKMFLRFSKKFGRILRNAGILPVE